MIVKRAVNKAAALFVYGAFCVYGGIFYMDNTIGILILAALVICIVLLAVVLGLQDAADTKENERGVGGIKRGQDPV